MDKNKHVKSKNENLLNTLKMNEMIFKIKTLLRGYDECKNILELQNQPKKEKLTN